MAPQETLKLDQLLEQIHEHRGEFRVFRTEIMGGADQDKPTGRLPMLEKASAGHERRIRRIEYFIAMVLGAAALLKALAWGADAVAHVIGAFR